MTTHCLLHDRLSYQPSLAAIKLNTTMIMAAMMTLARSTPALKLSVGVTSKLLPARKTPTQLGQATTVRARPHHRPLQLQHGQPAPVRAEAMLRKRSAQRPIPHAWCALTHASRLSTAISDRSVKLKSQQQAVTTNSALVRRGRHPLQVKHHLLHPEYCNGGNAVTLAAMAVLIVPTDRRTVLGVVRKPMPRLLL